MGIDTRNKRSGASMVSLPWRGMLPLADGLIRQADRQQVALMYPGILVLPSVLPTGKVTAQMTGQRPMPAVVAQSPNVGFVGTRPESLFEVEE